MNIACWDFCFGLTFLVYKGGGNDPDKSFWHFSNKPSIWWHFDKYDVVTSDYDSACYLQNEVYVYLSNITFQFEMIILVFSTQVVSQIIHFTVS